MSTAQTSAIYAGRSTTCPVRWNCSGQLWVNFDRHRGDVNVCSHPERLRRPGDALGQQRSFVQPPVRCLQASLDPICRNWLQRAVSPLKLEAGVYT